MTGPDPELVAALRNTLVERDRLRQDNARLSAQLSEPIAIVGMSCRFPGGVRTLADWWELLSQGRDAIGDFPSDRGWRTDDRSERGDYPRVGGFLDDALEFDADLFGISPREALAMDPQQRLLLEVSWEALEHARLDPLALRGSPTAVFAGVMYHDYADRLPTVPERVEGHLRTGSLASVVSGRVAYALGLHGPAVTVDTACSSSLVTMHLAAQALRQGECTLALAGGVTVMATPKVFAEFARQGGLAPDGRCKAFAAAADGTGWAEGVGVLVLERLSDATRLGHRVLAVMRGSAVNSDGASNGLTAPNGPAQQRVIRQALASAGLRTGDIDVVEGHGTGTRLGDPVEIQALLETYGRGRTRPLWLGSVKSNVGHTQAAAGVAGVIKTILAMRHGVVPPTMHVDEPSPHVDWSAGPVRLATGPQPWPETGGPRRAAVSSFGISGTNAHIVLEQFPEPESGPASKSPGRDDIRVSDTAAPLLPVAWPLSGHTAAAVAGQAGRMREHLAAHPDADLADLGLSLATTRANFGPRAVVIGGDRDELSARLAALAAGEPAPGVVAGTAAPKARVAMLFPGQGSQRLGMGSQLYERYPVFAAAFDKVCAALDPKLDRPVRDIVWATPDSAEAALLDRTDGTQAALFAVEVALYELLRSWGVEPAFLLGHSIGEVTAAYLAGLWSLADATTLVAARGRLMQRLPAGGAMLAIAAGEEAVRGLLTGRSERAGIAAINGPAAVVVSGDEPIIDEIAELAAAQGFSIRRLRVSHAFHSPRMRPMLDEFAAVCATLTFRRTTVPIVSNLTGELADPDELRSPGYWVRHIAEPVRFADGARWLRERGRVTLFLETGPGAALSSAVADADGGATVVSTLRRDRPEPESVTTALAEAFVAGAQVDWAARLPGAAVVDLPNYAFQRQRFWLDAGAAGADVHSAGLSAAGHPLLGAVVAAPDGESVVLTGRLSTGGHEWLADHRVGDRILLPATAFVDLVVRAAEEVGADRIVSLVVNAPLSPTEESVAIQVRVGPADATGNHPVSVAARTGDEPWTVHAEATVTASTSARPAGTATAWPPPGAVRVETDEIYRQLAESGLDYGPAFRGLRELWRDGTDLVARVTVPEDVDVTGYRIHPALLDAALHAAAALGGGLDSGIGARAGAGAGAENADGHPGRDITATESGSGTTLLPFAWHGVVVDAVGATELRVRMSAAAADRIALTLTDPQGRLVATVDELELRPAPTSPVRANIRRGRDPLYTVDWIALTDEPAPYAGPAPMVLRVDEIPRTPADPALPGNGSAAVQALTAGDGPVVVRDLLARVLDRVQLLLAETTDAPLVVVTRAAAALDPAVEDPDLAAAAVRGLLRSAQAEYPERIVLLDLDPGFHEGRELDAVIARALATAEPDLAVRDGVLHAPRLTRAPAADAPDLLRGDPWRLIVGVPGTIDSVRLEPVAEPVPPLGPLEVRIAMRAAGVNFRDVLIGLGMYPDPGAALGGEGAGIVLETGSAVTDLAPGDRVMGLFDGIGSTVTTDRRLVTAIPAGWSYGQAAAVPVVFLTAYHALADLAGLRAGESVLIHAATGGVGTAAMQLARHWGAEIYATASPRKWDVLRERGLGADRIANSRTLGFEDEFRAATGGAGVDVVLDALAGDFVDASLRLLSPGGRFVEMGVTDIRDRDAVAAAHPGVDYHSFLITEVDPERIREMLTELVTLFERGILTPPPLTGWDVRDAVAALRHLGQARHIGKVVLTWPPALDPDGTVLVTGGTGMIGRAMARHLVTAYGARNLLLAGRSGPAAPAAAELAAELDGLGARAEIVACDTSDGRALTRLLDDVPADRPLTMVIHAAGTVDDALFADQTAAHLDRVLPAKVATAWQLHRLTAGRDLAGFVVFSSAAGVLGTAGQANYAAANAYLDALAGHRRHRGLPGLSLAWGLWAQSSTVSAHLGERDLARMRRGGFHALSHEQALDLFDAALRGGHATAVPIHLDVTAVTDPPPLLRTLVRTRRAAAPAAAPADLPGLLTGRSAADQHRLLLDLIAGHVATVLDHGAGRTLDHEKQFADLGFDSLTTVELRNQLRRSTGVTLSPTVIFDHPTPVALATHLHSVLARPEPAGDLVAEAERLLDRLVESGAARTDLERLADRLADAMRRRGGDATAELIEIAGDDEIFDLIDRRADGLRA
ncbi:type I polyketide synthase [Nocardia aurantia]|uniref:Phenolphthiocerol synthesis polyketide synthase type I Pks15/1 n=1 Tax=Nocardia aurantia TaxID=2585199 RepID=A0A7K0DJA5_9NOCA|nr:type I polyketide synthase [Nocardia aurantia]MQY25789.1 Phenolphthiocerol synthesis polyketide synthase type I Pks15/1 [Nocardia aurantia]